MNRAFQLALVLLYIFPLTVVASVQSTSLSSRPLFFKCAKPASPGVPPSNKFCNFPPTVPVDLNIYTGTWFGIYISGLALSTTPGRCVTANYKITENGTIAVLNCAQTDEKRRPECRRGLATRRPGTVAPGKLQVTFPSVPNSLESPGSYNIAALLGNRKIGYWAAAVYTCRTLPNGENRRGVFILSRTTRFRRTILFLLKRQLRCRGYDVSDKFVKVGHTKNCEYFFEDTGFTVLQGPPSGM